jgi:site-specific recombinase XerD
MVGFHEQDSQDLGKKQVKEGKSAKPKPNRLYQPPKQPRPPCPLCASKRIYKDGMRYLSKGATVQRWLCRDCNYRFSERNHNKPLQKSSNWHINTASALTLGCQERGESRKRRATTLQAGGTSLVMSKTRQEKAQREGIATTNADLKGKIVQYLWYMKKQGYAETTFQTYAKILEMLVRLGSNLNDPESVKETIAKHDCGKGRKWNIVKAYTLFLKMQGLKWEKPRYYPVQKLPFIPTEKEIDDLIAGSSRQMALFLQVLKETGARRGEAFNLKWTDIDLATGTIRITPEKGSNPRAFALSPKLLRMLATQPHEHEGRIWQYRSITNLERTFRKQRKRTGFKLQNPKLLQIHFHILRHWKATTEYAKTKDLLYVQKLLGHRNIKTTLRYTQLLTLPQNEEYICKAAKTIDEATQLIEAGFQYVTEIGEAKLFRKLKTSYLGTL